MHTHSGLRNLYLLQQLGPVVHKPKCPVLAQLSHKIRRHGTVVPYRLGAAFCRKISCIGHMTFARSGAFSQTHTVRKNGESIKFGNSRHVQKGNPWKILKCGIVSARTIFGVSHMKRQKMSRISFGEFLRFEGLRDKQAQNHHKSDTKVDVTGIPSAAITATYGLQPCR